MIDNIASISQPAGRPNFTRVEVGTTTLWFSYKTLVGFDSGYVRMVRENIWGNTTGKHLNHIDPDKKYRVDAETFEAALKVALENTAY